MAKRSKILMTILDHYGKEKQRFLENCVQCGLCAEECPILPHTDVSEISSQDIQEEVFDCIDSGIPNQQAYTIEILTYIPILSTQV
jgi:ferredoxin